MSATSTSDEATARTPKTVEVRKLAAPERSKFIGVMARAFDDDPFLNWFAAQDSKRAGRIQQMFRIAVERMAGRYDELYTTSEIEGGAIWFPPNKWKLGVLQQLMMAPDMAKVSSWRRLPGVISGLGAVEERHPEKPHWYLLGLGVEPEQQGRSIGSQLMGPILERCDREGTPAYLESSKERNVPLYERHGFKVTEELVVPYNGPKIWLMWREPR